jgi:hypothetical protein
MAVHAIDIRVRWPIVRRLSEGRRGHLKGESLSRRRSDSDAIWHVRIASLQSWTGLSDTGRASVFCNTTIHCTANT